MSSGEVNSFQVSSVHDDCGIRDANSWAEDYFRRWLTSASVIQHIQQFFKACFETESDLHNFEDHYKNQDWDKNLKSWATVAYELDRSLPGNIRVTIPSSDFIGASSFQAWIFSMVNLVRANRHAGAAFYDDQGGISAFQASLRLLKAVYDDVKEGTHLGYYAKLLNVGRHENQTSVSRERALESVHSLDQPMMDIRKSPISADCPENISAGHTNQLQSLTAAARLVVEERLKIGLSLEAVPDLDLAIKNLAQILDRNG